MDEENSSDTTDFSVGVVGDAASENEDGDVPECMWTKGHTTLQLSERSRMTTSTELIRLLVLVLLLPLPLLLLLLLPGAKQNSCAYSSCREYG